MLPVGLCRRIEQTLGQAAARVNIDRDIIRRTQRRGPAGKAGERDAAPDIAATGPVQIGIKALRMAFNCI